MSTCDKCNHLSLFIKISSAITPGEDLKELLPVLMGYLGEYMSIDRGMVTILNRKSSEIIATSSYGMSDDEKARGIYQLGEGITGKVVETGEPIIIENTDRDPRFLNRTGSSRKGENNGFLCVPVKTTNEVIGSLSIDKSYSIKEAIHDDLKILIIISTMISRAVRLHQALHEEKQLVWENEELQARLARGFRNPGNIIGNSRIMRNMYDLIDKISCAGSTVLITGESGSGKELVARAIHYTGNRSDRPYIPFNCAALPESLLESELFGHTKGAFTGAFADKDGKFQAADGGTLFLDEIGEMSMTAQSKLLRVIQEKEVEKVGSNSPVKIDVRVVAATNRDLMELVDKGQFRLDLYYRLNVFPINVPPLRMRKTDIPLLVDTFIEKYSSITNNKVKRISTPAIDMLMSYHWPGNVRELENCIERAVILAEDEVIHSYHLPPSLQTIGKVPSGETGRLQSQLDILEYELVIEELKRTAGNIKEAAANLGITYRQFGLRLDKYRINIDKYKKQGVCNG